MTVPRLGKWAASIHGGETVWHPARCQRFPLTLWRRVCLLCSPILNNCGQYLYRLVLLTVLPAMAVQAEPWRVVTEDLPPYQIVVDNKLVGGSNFLAVSALLKQANIHSKIELLPWARAYDLALSQPNILIFSLARTPEREQQFAWLWKLQDINYQFYSLIERPDLQQLSNLMQIRQHTVAAVRHSVEANMLQDMGFIEGKNLFLTVTYKQAWQMVWHKRADFILAAFQAEDVLPDAKLSEADIFIKGFDPDIAIGLYFASSKQTSPHMLVELKQQIALLSQ